MIGLDALVRETKIKFYQWAMHDMGPSHPDLPKALHRLRELVEQRPPIETRPRSRCDSLAGLCARDPACADRHCPGLHQRDGGMQVHGPLSFPIEHS